MALPTSPHPDIVRDAVERCNISKAEIARRADMHENSLRDLGTDWSPRWKHLVRLCAAVAEIKAERA